MDVVFSIIVCHLTLWYNNRNTLNICNIILSSYFIASHRNTTLYRMSTHNSHPLPFSQARRLPLS